MKKHEIQVKSKERGAVRRESGNGETAVQGGLFGEERKNKEKGEEVEKFVVLG